MLSDPVIRRALFSVSDKTGLIELASFLAGHGVTLLSTGGTAAALRKAGLEVMDVSDVTHTPEMLEGRVKTLHPAIHGGLLARRDKSEHMDTLKTHSIEPIDLVVVNLYPFEETLARTSDEEELVENIDIGGPSMLRSAAKNFASVAVLSDPADYSAIIEELRTNAMTLSLQTRRTLAGKTYARTSSYDQAIGQWFAQSASDSADFFPAFWGVAGKKIQTLHYGENPHQRAAFYQLGGKQRGTLATATQLLGPALSYNNVQDANAALALVAEFDHPAVAIIKHANPCGVAQASSIEAAFQQALACDPVSAYGGIIALNRPLTPAFVMQMGALFVEVLIAPEVIEGTTEKLAHKKKLRLMSLGAMPSRITSPFELRLVSGGFLVQETDGCVLRDQHPLQIVTKQHPTPEQLNDLKFAFTVAKHVKSNAIVLARDGASIGIGAGQMSRIDSTRIACWKARESGLELQGSVLASDAFFPFADTVEMAAKEGVTAMIQPGGSIRDEEVIAAADQHGIAMVLTGIRHFRH